MEDVAWHELLEQVLGSGVAQRVEARHRSDRAESIFRMPIAAACAARLEHPRRRDARGPLLDRRAIDDVDELGAADAARCAPASASPACRGTRGRSFRPCRARAGIRAASLRSRRRNRRARRCDRSVRCARGRRPPCGCRRSACRGGCSKSASIASRGQSASRNCLVGQEQHAAALTAALAQELVAFVIGRDTEQRQHSTVTSLDLDRVRPPDLGSHSCGDRGASPSAAGNRSRATAAPI